ncbi:MAG TPA: type 4a pilus biogenesis protein PilO [Candidatus Paceibacterota bacterium]|nr:type 4a pilus biogenesis protein PilO [Candidatus Paceibacterota bacterium]
MTSGKRIFGAFVIAIALFFMWPGVIGEWQYVSALRDAVAERTDLLSQRTTILATVSSAYADYQSKISAADGIKFAELVPVKKDTAELVSALQDMATTAGAQLTEADVAVDQSKSAAQYQTLKLSLQLNGTYGSLRQFLGAVEQYVRVLNVDSIQASVDTRNPGQLNFTILADAYFLK